MNKSEAGPRGQNALFFCVSLNPAIDTRLVLDEFQVGRVNRVSEVHRTPGGKAAHVAMALQGLGANPRWIGLDRKSTRLNSSHGYTSYAVFCLKTKNKNPARIDRQLGRGRTCIAVAIARDHITLTTEHLVRIVGYIVAAPPCWIAA